MARLDRREFLRTGGQAALGIAGILGRAPASWAARELSILTAVNYAPTSDAKLAELGKRFAKATGVNVRIDHIQSVQMPAKLSAELMARARPRHHEPRDALPVALPARASSTCPTSRRPRAQARRVVSVPEGARPGQGPVARRSATCSPRSRAATGSICSRRWARRPPDTWEDLLRAGRKLKKLGHPVGFAISQTTDSVTTLYSILWCFGAKDVAADGKTITINSQGDRGGRRLRPRALRRRHGPGRAVVGQRLEQPVAELGRGLVDPQPDQSLRRRQGEEDAGRRADRLPSLAGGSGGPAHRRRAAQPRHLEVQQEHRGRARVPPLVLRARAVPGVGHVGRQLQPPDVARHGEPPGVGHRPEVQAAQERSCSTRTCTAGRPRRTSASSSSRTATSSRTCSRKVVTNASSPRRRSRWAETEIKRMFEKK